jgi:hypothetical protein
MPQVPVCCELCLPFKILLKFGGRRKQLLDGGLLFRVASLERIDIQRNVGGVVGPCQFHCGKQVVQNALAAHESWLLFIDITPTWRTKQHKNYYYLLERKICKLILKSFFVRFLYAEGKKKNLRER